MIDFHTHCLPGVDDGAATLEESLAMLRHSLRQGITAVAATPHFFPGEETTASFLERRATAMDELQKAVESDLTLAGNIQIIPGAEVLVKEGFSHMDLKPLCLQNSDILLLELPFASPPVWLYEEIENIVFEQGLRVMLAHVDRYMSWYSTERMGYLVDTPGLIVQLNGDTFLKWRGYRHLRRWLPQTDRLVLGSDMHDSRERDQNLATACRCLRRKRLGRQWLQTVESCGAHLLEQLLEGST